MRRKCSSREELTKKKVLQPVSLPQHAQQVNLSRKGEILSPRASCSFGTSTLPSVTRATTVGLETDGFRSATQRPSIPTKPYSEKKGVSFGILWLVHKIRTQKKRTNQSNAGTQLLFLSTTTVGLTSFPAVLHQVRTINVL